MPLSPFTVTPDDHQSLAGNPWIESKEIRHHLTEDQSSEQSGDDTRKANVRISHVRSHTAAGHPLHAPSPPESTYDLSTCGASLDLHETRPSLRRVINASVPDVAREDSDGGRARPKGSGTQREADAEVIVHHIQPTDSLPGVALKYNISVAALRSVNKLWANDSIHLRQVLYIPVRAVKTEISKSVSAGSSLRPSRRPPPLHSAPDLHTRHSSSNMRRVSEWDTITEDSETIINPVSVAHTIAAGNNSTIKRVPLSELSFFPPPSAAALSPPSHLSSRSVRPMSPSRSRSNPSHSASPESILPRGSPEPTSMFFGTPKSSANGPTTLGLASFFNGAKDEIISRLSFDSVRGSSDTVEDPEVEMDIVRPKTALDRGKDDRINDVTSLQRGAMSFAWSSWARDSVVASTSHKPKSQTIRNVQLQPSPRMEIPVPLSADKATNGTGQLATTMDSP